MFNTILVAVDQSEAAQAACDLALTIAKEDNASLILLSIVDVSKLIAVAGYEAPYPVDAIAMLRAAQRRTARRYESRMRKARRQRGNVDRRRRRMRRDLARRARPSRRADRMGTHGRQGLSRLFIGSVAEGVLRRATVPVITTPNAQPRQRAKKAAGYAPPRSRASSHATMPAGGVSVAVRIGRACHARVGARILE